MKKTIYSPHCEVIRQKLIEIRTRAKLTQRKLAEKLGREHSFGAHCELGKGELILQSFTVSLGTGLNY